jgi:hypothetical protein
VIIHVDMSGKFHKYENVGIAWTDTKKKQHKGISLSGKLIKKLKSETNCDNSKLYAICIYLILKGDLENLKRIIICNDENFIEVKDHLGLLFSKINYYKKIEIISISKHREKLGVKKLKSLADSFANSYRKRGYKRANWNRGRNLNTITCKHEDIMKILENKKGR